MNNYYRHCRARRAYKRCRERCIGGAYGGHHPMCPDSRECPVCEGPVEADETYCETCVDENPGLDGEQDEA